MDDTCVSREFVCNKTQFDFKENKENSEILLTIIVPIFNKSSYLPAFLECCKGLKSDLYKLLFVDDCSTDTSVEILEKYLKIARPGSARLIRCTKNNGVSIARQIGLKNSDSAYITFADPDDEFTESHYESLLNSIIANQADMCWSDYERKVGDERVRISQNFLDQPTELIKQVLKGSMHCGLWNKIFRRKFLESHRINFPSERILMCEDLLFVLMCLRTSPRITYSSSVGYCYIDNSSSLSSRVYFETCRSFLSVASILEMHLMSGSTREDFLAWKGGVFMSVCLSSTVSGEEFSQFRKRFGMYSYRNLSLRAKVLCILSNLGFRKLAIRAVSITI